MKDLVYHIWGNGYYSICSQVNNAALNNMEYIFECGGSLLILGWDPQKGKLLKGAISGNTSWIYVCIANIYI